MRKTKSSSTQLSTSLYHPHPPPSLLLSSSSLLSRILSPFFLFNFATNRNKYLLLFNFSFTTSLSSYSYSKLQLNLDLIQLTKQNLKDWLGRLANFLLLFYRQTHLFILQEHNKKSQKLNNSIMQLFQPPPPQHHHRRHHQIFLSFNLSSIFNKPQNVFIYFFQLEYFSIFLIIIINLIMAFLFDLFEKKRHSKLFCKRTFVVLLSAKLWLIFYLFRL